MKFAFGGVSPTSKRNARRASSHPWCSAWSPYGNALDAVDAADDAATDVPICIGDRIERCNGVDDDCDGERDEGCTCLPETPVHMPSRQPWAWLLMRVFAADLRDVFPASDDLSALVSTHRKQ